MGTYTGQNLSQYSDSGEQSRKYMKTLETYLGFEIHRMVETITQMGSSHMEFQVTTTR